MPCPALLTAYTTASPSIHLQGQLLMLAMKLMPGGSLREALQQAGCQGQLQWSARWAGMRLALQTRML
jgi:hypothetical protein